MNEQTTYGQCEGCGADADLELVGGNHGFLLCADCARQGEPSETGSGDVDPFDVLVDEATDDERAMEQALFQREAARQDAADAWIAAAMRELDTDDAGEAEQYAYGY